MSRDRAPGARGGAPERPWIDQVPLNAFCPHCRRLLRPGAPSPAGAEAEARPPASPTDALDS